MSGDAFEVAAYWHGVFEGGEPSVGIREAFEKWLSADPHNLAAYTSIERAWAGMANAGVDDRILSMRRDALVTSRRSHAHLFRAGTIAASIALMVVLVGGILIRHVPLSVDPAAGEFATQIGQRSSITLADGSIVVLNTASRIQVSFDARIRRVQLLSGQAWFEVAKNQVRPFVVEAGDRIVTAHGTAFDVRLEGRDTLQVTLVEGRVSVEALKRNGSVPGVLGEHEDLVPGDQLIVTATRPATKHNADVAKATSWREGQIIFDDDTLGNAVAEVNRYSASKVVLVDPRLASLRVSGVFIAGHSESFVETVTGNFPIKVTSGPDGQFLLTATNEGRSKD